LDAVLEFEVDNSSDHGSEGTDVDEPFSPTSKETFDLPVDARSATSADEYSSAPGNQDDIMQTVPEPDPTNELLLLCDETEAEDEHLLADESTDTIVREKYTAEEDLEFPETTEPSQAVAELPKNPEEYYGHHSASGRAALDSDATYRFFVGPAYQDVTDDVGDDTQSIPDHTDNVSEMDDAQKDSAVINVAYSDESWFEKQMNQDAEAQYESAAEQCEPPGSEMKEEEFKTQSTISDTADNKYDNRDVESGNFVSSDDLADTSSVDSFSTVEHRQPGGLDDDRFAELASISSSYHSDGQGSLHDIHQEFLQSVAGEEKDESYEILEELEVGDVPVHGVVFEHETDASLLQSTENLDVYLTPTLLASIKEEEEKSGSQKTTSSSEKVEVETSDSSKRVVSESSSDIANTQKSSEKSSEKSAENDDASVSSSLQEFERLEKEIQGRGASDVLLVTAESPTLPTSNRDEKYDTVSISSSLAEFENLEHDLLGHSDSMEMSDVASINSSSSNGKQLGSALPVDSLRSSNTSLAEFELLENQLGLDEQLEAEAQKVATLLERGSLPLMPESDRSSERDLNKERLSEFSAQKSSAGSVSSMEKEENLRRLAEVEAPTSDYPRYQEIVQIIREASLNVARFESETPDLEVLQSDEAGAVGLLPVADELITTQPMRQTETSMMKIFSSEEQQDQRESYSSGTTTIISTEHLVEPEDIITVLATSPLIDEITDILGANDAENIVIQDLEYKDESKKQATFDPIVSHEDIEDGNTQDEELEDKQAIQEVTSDSKDEFPDAPSEEPFEYVARQDFELEVEQATHESHLPKLEIVDTQKKEGFEYIGVEVGSEYTEDSLDGDHDNEEEDMATTTATDKTKGELVKSDSDYCIDEPDSLMQFPADALTASSDSYLLEPMTSSTNAMMQLSVDSLNMVTSVDSLDLDRSSTIDDCTLVADEEITRVDSEECIDEQTVYHKGMERSTDSLETKVVGVVAVSLSSESLDADLLQEKHRTTAHSISVDSLRGTPCVLMDISATSSSCSRSSSSSMTLMSSSSREIMDMSLDSQPLDRTYSAEGSPQTIISEVHTTHTTEESTFETQYATSSLWQDDIFKKLLMSDNSGIEVMRAFDAEGNLMHRQVKVSPVDDEGNLQFVQEKLSESETDTPVSTPSSTPNVIGAFTRIDKTRRLECTTEEEADDLSSDISPTTTPTGITII